MNAEIIHPGISRRHFLGRASAGIGAAALASLLNPRLFASASAPHFAALSQPHA